MLDKFEEQVICRHGVNNSAGFHPFAGRMAVEHIKAVNIFKQVLSGAVGTRLRELMREICHTHDIEILQGGGF